MGLEILKRARRHIKTWVRLKCGSGYGTERMRNGTDIAKRNGTDMGLKRGTERNGTERIWG